MTEKRIIELETRLSFAEHAINELSDVVARQALQIEKLEAINNKLLERVRDLAESSAAPGKDKMPVDERPPHY